MAALDVGGECQGLPCESRRTRLIDETEILWMREMIREGYIRFFRKVTTPQGPVDALAFVMDRQSARFVDVSPKKRQT
jgi:cation transport protein ChaC